MTLTSVEWWVLCVISTSAIGCIGYFLKRTMNTTDSHDKDINDIKRTYVTKNELKEIKTELRDETKVLAADVAEIKNNYLTKDDYYRTQVETDRKLDRIYELLIKERNI